ncbi:hypothetical protein [Eisenibacter elegans]|uniref:hypothetical protein n=1 Tax=Eisenibacter elegans TaxID=997 RepID=UPI0012B5CA3E|nr:hypothetical protein [Eisenibacter elegans]
MTHTRFSFWDFPLRGRVGRPYSSHFVLWGTARGLHPHTLRSRAKMSLSSVRTHTSFCSLSLLWWLSLLVWPLHAQQKNPVAETLAQQALRQQTTRYTFAQTPHRALQMSFDNHLIVSAEDLQTLKNKQIDSVHLVYTDFPKGRNFDELNRSRIYEVAKYLPQLIDTNIPWRYIAQTYAQTYPDAQAMFHGIVVFFTALPDTQTPTDQGLTTQQPDRQPDNDGGGGNNTTTYDDPIPIPERLLPIEDAPNMDYRQPQNIYQIVAQDYVTPDSTVFKAVGRNWQQWPKNVIVVDWTASMYHYGAQLLVWFRKNEPSRESVRMLLFFNDGDSKSAAEKVIGRTGGLHRSPSMSSQDIVETMARAAKAGSGGDLPENDLEALLYAARKHPEAANIIFIADSKSTARDIQLLPELIRVCRTHNQQVHVILCDADQGIQPDYIAIAYGTKGSLHTMENDWYDLNTLETKQGLVIGKVRYRFLNDKIITKTLKKQP